MIHSRREALLLCLGCNHERDEASLTPRWILHLRQVLDIREHPIDELHPELFVGHFPTTELHRELDIAWLKRRFISVGGNMHSLARELGIARPSLYKWLKRLDVDPGDWRQDVIP